MNKVIYAIEYRHRRPGTLKWKRWLHHSTTADVRLARMVKRGLLEGDALETQGKSFLQWQARVVPFDRRMPR